MNKRFNEYTFAQHSKSGERPASSSLTLYRFSASMVGHNARTECSASCYAHGWDSRSSRRVLSHTMYSPYTALYWDRASDD